MDNIYKDATQTSITPYLILAGGLFLGLLLDKIVLRYLRTISARTHWVWDDIFAESVSGFPFIWCFLGGTYGMALTASVKAEKLLLIQKSLLVLLILSITVFLARLSIKIAEYHSRKEQGFFHSATILTHLTRTFIYIVGFLTIFYSLGINITPALTALGIGGLAVALALQDTLSNFFAGLQIIASKQIATGDYIRITSGEEGHVTDITWRNTTLRNQMNNMVIIPNSKLASEIFTNYHRPEKESVLQVQVAVGYQSDLARVEAITIEIAKEVMKEVDAGVPEFEPSIRFHTFADSSINFNVVLRGKDYTDLPLIKHEFIKRLHERFRKEGIEIPYPTRNVYLNEKSET